MLFYTVLFKKFYSFAKNVFICNGRKYCAFVSIKSTILCNVKKCKYNTMYNTIIDVK